MADFTPYEYQIHCLENGYQMCRVEPMEFYREIFPVGELEERAERDEENKPIYVERDEYKYNGIAIEVVNKDGKRNAKRHFITDDLEALELLQESKNFCLLSPISYVGGTRHSANARMMYALCIEVDNLAYDEETHFPDGLVTLLGYFDKGGLPCPTYLVLSGSGVHLYYVFEKPIALYPTAVKSLEGFKRDLTEHLWIKGITFSYSKDKIQYESLFQGFRLVGGITKNGDRTVCYKLGERITVDYLNSGNWVFPENRIDLGYQPSKLTLDKAFELYPEWFQKRIVEKDKSKGRWVCNRAVYDWWKRKLQFASYGHRYYYLFVLCVYAIKCDIDRAEVEKDCFGYLDYLDRLSPDSKSRFTEKDVTDALQAYEDGDLVTYPINSIVNRTGIPIKKNKRNGRPQKLHVQIMTSTRDILHPNGTWRNSEGRPLKQDIVLEWRKAHPNGRKADCIRETGLDKKTVYKWWE